MTNSFYQIVAMTESKGIGLNGRLPWSLKSELIYFSKITTLYGRPDPINDPLNVVIMGRKTWDSLPLKSKPLKNRINIILSSNTSLNDSNAMVFPSLTACMEYLKSVNHSSVFIIGGSSLYSQTLDLCCKLFITKVFMDVKCDTFYSEWDESQWKKISMEETNSLLEPIFPINYPLKREENGVNFEYQIWTRS